MSWALRLAEAGLLPDAVIRIGVRRLVRRRLRDEGGGDVERESARYAALLDGLRNSPVALDAAQANEQHYEVPAEFFRLVLGPRLKYSAAFWPPGTRTLAEAETRMLELVAGRSALEDGMRVLDLGGGWGAFTLWAAQRYPRARFLAVSNSVTQKRYIDARAAALGLDNVAALTADVNSLTFDERFDRVVSVEMFEHVRNYAALLSRIAGWLAADGKLFVHVFCHRHLMYPFDDEGDDNWMGRHFFTGGLMPARDTLLHFQDRLKLRSRWEISGNHYRRTARAWRANLDANRSAADRVLAAAGAHPHAVQRWRMFFMACEELFGWRGGSHWLVCHYLFAQRE